MARNRFPVNVASINQINPIGVPLVFPPPPVITGTWRQLRHEDLIRRDGRDALFRPLSNFGPYNCVLAFKRLRGKTGDTPLRHKIRVGYISPIALERVGFTGDIVAGDTIEVASRIWYVDHAHLQEVGGVPMRWVLDLMQTSGK